MSVTSQPQYYYPQQSSGQKSRYNPQQYPPVPYPPPYPTYHPQPQVHNPYPYPPNQYQNHYPQYPPPQHHQHHYQYQPQPQPQYQHQQQQPFNPQIQSTLSKSPIKQVSYQDLFQRSIEEYEQNHTMLSEKCSVKPGMSYTLYEDLKILVVMNNPHEKVSLKDLASLKVVNRSAESIKTRYNHFLKYLIEEDLEEIYVFLQNNGVQGYMIFENLENNQKSFKTIQFHDPKLQQNSQIQQLQQQQEEEENRQALQQKQYFQYKNRDMKNISLKRSVQKQDIQDIENSQFEQKKKQKVEKKQSVKKIPGLEALSGKEKMEAEELDNVLTVIGNWLKISKKKLGEILHKSSGDLNIFDDYLNSQDKDLLWEEEDDEILRSCLEKCNDNQNKEQQQQVPRELELFAKYKGGYSLKRRIEYLGLECDFEFVENSPKKSNESDKKNKKKK